MKELIEQAKKNTDGCVWKEMGELPNGKKLCLVLGYAEGYDHDDGLEQVEEGERVYTLCGKLAYNCDDLQCDYEWDWAMPEDEQGNIYDTECAVCEGDNLLWWEENTEDIIKLFKKGVLRTR